MMRNRSSKFLPAFLLVGSAVASPARAQTPRDIPVVTLAEARRLSVSIDPNAVEARGRIETAEWARRAATLNLFTPHLRASTNYTHFSDPFFNFGTGGISPNAASATLDVNYSLLGTGKFGFLKSTRAAVKSADANETVARYRATLETDAAYFAVLADHELTRVANDRLKRAVEQLGIARVRVIAGESLSSDSLQLFLEVSRARFSILSMDSALITSRLRLGRRVGLDGPAEAAPIDTAPPPPLPFTQEQAIAEMRRRGPDVVAARAEEQSANADVGTARELYLPEISIGSTIGRYDTELFPNALKRNQYTITVGFPLWDGGLRELAISRRRADRDVASANRADLEHGSAEIMARAYQGYLTSRGGIDIALLGVVAAAENYRVQNARYREGATTILDLLEAQVSLSQAQAALVQSRYSSRLAVAQIEALLGRRIFEPSTTYPNVR